MEQFWLQISASTFGLKSPFELTLLQLFIDNKKYYFCELFQLFNLEAVLETNCITKSYTKEVIKKLLQNVLKNGKVVKKTQTMQMIGLVPPVLIKI